MRRGLHAIAVACLAVHAAGAARAETPARIVIREFMFRPATLRVAAGAEVSWVNEDQEPHTVRSDTGLFRSGALDTHEAFSFRFTKPGTYRFVCSIHPQMTGTVVVE